MEFIITIDTEEFNKMIKIINNNKLVNLEYEIIERTDEQVKFRIVSHDDEVTEELYEIFFEYFDSALIEEVIKNNNNKIKLVIISKDGNYSVLDYSNKSILNLRGKWEDNFNEILSLIDSKTKILDERI